MEGLKPTNGKEIFMKNTIRFSALIVALSVSTAAGASDNMNALSDGRAKETLAAIDSGAGGMAETSPFPLGYENTANARYFSGKSWLAPLTQKKELGVPIANVTFEPGCRNNWHSHSGGQILIAVGGRGYYQERGKPARPLKPGDVVEISPGVVHWHGASPDSRFAHLAISCNPEINKATWLEAVSDEEYANAAADGRWSVGRSSGQPLPNFIMQNK